MQEIFNTNNNLMGELNKASDKIEKLEQELTEIKKRLAETQQELATKQTEFNSQLQQINILFDEKARNFTNPIEFTGLYKALKTQLNNLQNKVVELQIGLRDKEKLLANFQQEKTDWEEEIKN
jgi:chromosome segregation ATPase